MTETTTHERPEPTQVKAEPARPLIEDIVLSPSDLKGELVPYEGLELVVAKRKPFWRRWYDFPLLVLLPLCAAAVYLFLIAADRYMSETEFIVRSQSDSSTNPTAGLTSIVQQQPTLASGFSRAVDETYAVNEYLVSRDVVQLLADNNHLGSILSRPEADPFVRFPNFYSRNDFEHLYQYFQNIIYVYLDETTGITTLQTYANRPKDAQDLTAALMGYAEALINRMNTRAHNDAIRYAQSVVDQGREQVAAVEAKLKVFRNTHGTVDPGQESSAALQMIEQLTEDRARLEASLGRQAALTPSNPGNDSIRKQIASYKAEIDRLRKDVVGTATSTASALSEFESLVLERTIAAQSLQAALLNFDQARKDAQDQHLYIETIEAPHLADYAEYPKRFLDMLIVAAVAIGFWLIQRSLRISASEHTA